jgi:tetraacyldisaccharide-1-P 4'-kinase
MSAPGRELSLIERLYAWGLSLDRRFTSAESLPAPVVSVGNVAAGGRGKTPFVIWLARGLAERGFSPVVLTRGYGRRSRLPVALVDPVAGRSEETGDEALEISWLARVPVLVGAERLLNARDWLAKGAAPRTVFLLDDGFQHWKLSRDFDLVLVDDFDRRDRLLPLGRLREPFAAVERADLVLERGRDFEKRTLVARAPQGECVALTTRAPDPAYERALASALGRAPRVIALADHAPVEDCRIALARAGVGAPVLLGAKEAVKLLPSGVLDEFFREGWLPSRANGLERDAHFVRCELEVRDDAAVWRPLLAAVEPKEGGPR